MSKFMKPVSNGRDWYAERARYFAGLRPNRCVEFFRRLFGLRWVTVKTVSSTETRHIKPALGDSVMHVVFLRAVKEVGFFHTSRIIAFVAGEHSWWEWPASQLQRYVRRHSGFPVHPQLAVA